MECVELGGEVEGGMGFGMGEAMMIGEAGRWMDEGEMKGVMMDVV